MMLNWFKRQEDQSELPEFWKKYARSFERKLPDDLSQTRFVVFDTETTGFDFNQDRILSIGAVSIQNRSIEIRNNLEIYLDQKTFNPDTVPIHGIIKNEKFEKLTELQALVVFLKYIENAVLVAHHATFDIKMINKALQRNGLPKLKNRALDTAVLYNRTRITSNLIDTNKSYSLDEIAEVYNIDLTDRHTATGDAYITALIFMKLLARLDNKGKPLSLTKLYKL